MKCFNCGKEIEDNSTFCPECGISIIQLNNRYEPFIFIIDDPTVNRKFFAKLVIEKINYPSFEKTTIDGDGIKFSFKGNHQGELCMEEIRECPKQ